MSLILLRLKPVDVCGNLPLVNERALSTASAITRRPLATRQINQACLTPPYDPVRTSTRATLDDDREDSVRST